MRLNTKIMLPIAVILIFIFLVFFYLVLGLYKKGALITTQNNNYERLTELSQRLAAEQEKTEYSLLLYLINKDPKALEDIRQSDNAKDSEVDAAKTYIQNEELRKLLADYVKSRDSISIYRDKLVSDINSGDNNSINTSYGEWHKRTDIIREKIKAFNDSNKKYLSKNTEFYNDIISEFIFTTAVVLIIVPFALMAFYYYIKRHVTNPLIRLTRFVSKQNKKATNLNFEYDQSRVDEIGVLNKKFTEMSERIRNSQSELETQVMERTAELSKKNSFSDAVISSVGDALLVVDNDGKITLVNQAFEDVTNFTKEEAIGNKFYDLVEAYYEDGTMLSENERLISRARDGLDSRYTMENQVYYKRKNGELFPVAGIASAIKVEGEFVGGVIVFSDITKIKQMEKAKSELVSMAAHQLRTPLSSIGWYIELLESSEDNLTSNQRNYINQISKGNYRMVEMVKSFLDASRIELGTIKLEKEEFDLLNIVEEEIKEQAQKAIEKNMNIKFTPDRGVPKVFGDRNKIRMVIQNLISNSIKYSREGGVVDISVKNKDNNKIIFRIEDRGHGIPEEDQQKVFSKLFRSDNIKDIGVEGTGLGLYIAKNIIERSDGKIWFESRENIGTIFYIELGSNQ